jgi:HEPN domain-containing protein
MKPLDVKDWFEIADDDLDSAIYLTGKYKKPTEIICYHCTQATEKYLKAFLAYNNVAIEKTHNIKKLINKCSSIDRNFQTILRECIYINDFTNQIHYQSRGQINETDMDLCIKYTKKIRDFQALIDIRKIVFKNNEQ